MGGIEIWSNDMTILQLNNILKELANEGSMVRGQEEEISHIMDRTTWLEVFCCSNSLASLLLLLSSRNC